MDYNQAKEAIKQKISCTSYLEKSKGGLYCCPKCNSGHGPNGTGAVEYYKDTNTWYCHKCEAGGDVISLFQIVNNCDFTTAVRELAREEGITIDKKAPQNDFKEPKREKTQEEATKNEHRADIQQRKADFFDYCADCLGKIDSPAASSYLQARKISLGTAIYNGIGFDPAADPINAPGGQGKALYPTPRIIIPCGRGFYTARAINPEVEIRYANPKGAAQEPFNIEALYAQEAQEVFITEGAFDALSLLEIGEAAVSLNSAKNWKRLIKKLEEKRTQATLILCLDNDETGKADQESLKDGLQRLNIPYIAANICGRYKDPNEALCQDKEAFIAAVQEAKRIARTPDSSSLYIDTFMQADIEKFKADKKTGFENLDRKAGGLYAGLYALAAISSLGKTSFALQLADQLAAGGNDVIFFSLEQSKLELVTKSIARGTAQADRTKAVTSLAIRKGYMPEQVQAAAARYKAEVADRLSIVEGNFLCDVSFIGNYIREYIRRNGKRPIVFIDYLQILQPTEEGKKQGTKEIVDSTVTELKRLSREQELTVFIISSVNRANYLTPIDFESLKESGSIEYTCDVIWGLQLQCLADDIFNSAKDSKISEKRARIREAKAADPRKIELVCLKNRYGISNYSCYFEYFPANDLFTEGSFPEDGTAEPPEEWNQPAQIRL